MQAKPLGMKILRRLALTLSALAALSASAHPGSPNFSREEIIRDMALKLQSPEGLRLRVHGVNHDSGLYVGAYSYDTIFNEIQVSLLTRVPEVRQTLLQIGRHDVIRVWGRLLDFDGPQPHLGLSQIVVEANFEMPGQPHRPEVDWEAVSRDLEGQDEILVVVHTVQQDGQILVIEYKEHIFPIFTREYQDQARLLNRQDIVRIRYTLQDAPERPIHLLLRPDAAGRAIDLVDNIAEQHGELRTITGSLVLFPQSPIVRFNVFAIKIDVGHGLSRTYTLINFDDSEVFRKIREKLQAAWDEGDASCVTNDRNKLLNTCIQVSATGPINWVDPNQANPQVLLKSADDIEL
jgi:hypothetical protein